MAVAQSPQARAAHHAEPDVVIGSYGNAAETDIFLPTPTSENCPSLKCPTRLARNRRNHREPSEPAATSVGTAPPRGRSNVLPVPSPQREELDAVLQRRPYGRHAVTAIHRVRPRGIDLMASKNFVFQPGHGVAGQVGEPGGSIGRDRSRPSRVIGYRVQTRAISPPLLTWAIARAAKSVYQALPLAAMATPSGSMSLFDVGSRRCGRCAHGESHRHGRW